MADPSAKLPWKGYAILGNGNLTVVYSDDARISAATHHLGIQHLYFQDYTADYVASTGFDVLDGAVGMKNFFTTETQLRLTNGAAGTVRCFVHPEGAAVLSLSTAGAGGKGQYRFQTVLRRVIKTDHNIAITSLREEDGMVVAVWSNGTALAIAPESTNDRVRIDDATVWVSGILSDHAAGSQVLLVPASSASEAARKLRSLRQKKDLEASASQYWNDWMNRGALPDIRSAGAQAAQYLEAYKRNLYCVRSANLNGQIPADITGQFVTNNMPQLYPRDAMMCARVLLLTGHAEEAKQVIEFWAKPDVPMKSPGEWYARYDAHGKAVDGGSGARFDEPEWDSNGYYIYLLDQYHAKTGVWLANPDFVYKLADFLVDHLSPNGLLWEGGIVEWTGYLPATNMIDAAVLQTAAKMAREFGDGDRAERYSATARKISAALPEMFDKSRQTYADVRFTEQKGANGVSLTKQSGQKAYLWDTTANVGVIWGYPNHREIDLSNIFYDHNTVKLEGGMQYFDSPDSGLAGYGHGVFFFTTAAAAEYQSLYGKNSAAKQFIDWMVRNANCYGLMPEHISPDGKECSPASPLSWCGARIRSRAAVVESDAALSGLVAVLTGMVRHVQKEMFRRSHFVYGILLTSAVSVVLAASASWQKSDPSQWTSEDVYQILNNSPWSKSVSVSVGRGSGYGSQTPGTGRNNGTWGEGPTGGGMGGGMGRMGGGGMGGGMGGGGMGRGRGSGYPSAEQPNVIVQWESALPVRLAEAKSSGSPPDAAAMKPLNEYVIAVIGLPKSGFRSESFGGGSDDDSDDSRLADHLKVITVLSVGHERLNPVKVELNQGRDARAIFHFEKSEPITLHDKDIEFRITSDRMEIRKKFALKDMEYRGKLEL